jgi:methionyl-tRNA synthetase
MEPPEGCRFCGGTLPEGRAVTYCPHCGQNLAAKHCAGCGTELDPAWKFCVNCGKKAV